MVWLLPAALAGLALVAGPIAIHLLTRRHARRVKFPTIRFLRAAKPAAVRFRRPSDVTLLAVRIAIVAAAVVAAAQPLILTPWRVSKWNARTVRALVIDTSPSMRRTDAAGETPAAIAAATVDAETESAFGAVTLQVTDLEEGIGRAVQQLNTMPPGRREIVVLSDFQRATLDETALATVPRDVGLRFVRAGAMPQHREWTGADLDGWRGARWRPQVTFSGPGTAASWQRMAVMPAVEGITLAVRAGDEAVSQDVLKAAVSLGVPSSRPGAIVIAFTGAPRPDAFARAQPIASAWIVRLAQTLRTDDLLERAREDAHISGRRATQPWTSLVRDARGQAVVLAAEHEGALLIDTTAPVASTFAIALVRAALLTRNDADAARADEEVLTIPDEQLARWRREPGPVTAQMWPHADVSDARWFWAAALALLLLEGRLRRHRNLHAAKEPDAAAA
jgi:Aerotolerance regulator N-terminal